MTKKPLIFPLVFRGTGITLHKEGDPLGSLIARNGRIHFVPAENIAPPLHWPIVRAAASSSACFSLDTPSERDMPFVPRTVLTGSFSSTALAAGEIRTKRHSSAEFEEQGFVGVFSLHLRHSHLGPIMPGEMPPDAFLSTAFNEVEWQALLAWMEEFLPPTTP